MMNDPVTKTISIERKATLYWHIEGECPRVATRHEVFEIIAKQALDLAAENSRLKQRLERVTKASRQRALALARMHRAAKSLRVRAKSAESRLDSIYFITRNPNG